jgi:putative endonuclease
MKSLGNQGEVLAAEYFRQNGYNILECNWRCQRGEIDIVAIDGATLVFIEVKTRRTEACGDGFAAVDARKQERLRLLARLYIHQTRFAARSYRFDVASVDGNTGSVTVIKDAF